MNEIDNDREPWEIISLIAAVWLGCFGLDCAWTVMDYASTVVEAEGLWLENYVTGFPLL